MTSCCGGDANLADEALRAVMGAPLAPAAAMDGGKVRVEYIGTDRGAQTWEYPFGSTIRLGNNTIDRYRDVTPAQAEWLREHGIPIRVVPVFDGPDAPTEPLPILQPTDVLTPDAVNTKVLRPRDAMIAAIMPCRGRAEQTVRNMRRLLATAGDVEWQLICMVDRDPAVMRRSLRPICQSGGWTGEPGYWHALQQATDYWHEFDLIVNLANDLLPGQHWLSRAAMRVPRDVRSVRPARLQ
jgi:hypothetical protein